MEITEVRIKLMDSAEDRLRGFCSVTFDNCFVIRDLKIIDGNSGLFVAMPSRKLTAHCPRCRVKNHMRSKFCNNCGTRLPQSRSDSGPDSRSKLYADVAHPINTECREQIQSRIAEEYHAEVERSKLPNYRSRYDDDYESSGSPHPGALDDSTRIDSPGSSHGIAPHQQQHNRPSESATEKGSGRSEND